VDHDVSLADLEHRAGLVLVEGDARVTWEFGLYEAADSFRLGARFKPSPTIPHARKKLSDGGKPAPISGTSRDLEQAFRRQA
jgi:hypothetical protein